MSKPKSIFGVGAQGSGSGGLRLSQELAKAESWSEAILPAEADAEASESETSRRPIVIFAGLLCLLMGILILRLAILQLVDGQHNLALADGNRTREIQSRAPRGLIYDRSGVVLAQNQAAFDITVTELRLPREDKERQREYKEVAELLSMTPAEVAKIAEPDCPPTACPSPLLPRLIKANIAREQALMFDQVSSRLSGFTLDVNPIREYKDEGLLAAFLGYTGRISPEELKQNRSYSANDLIGKLGIESSYEAVLKGRDGGEQTEVDAVGRPVKVLSSRPAVPGNSLVLSIDQALQKRMAEAIQKQAEAAGVTRAAGVALNPETGEVLAAVSLPTYDNNLFARGISQSDYTRLTSDPGQPLFNKITSGAYPAGSVIKPLIAAAALEEGIVTPNTLIDDKGQIEITNKYDPTVKYIYKSWERTTGLGIMNIFSAIAQSSNIFFYTVAGGDEGFGRALGVDKLTDYYKKFGLGSRTGVDLPSESIGRVPTPAWKKALSGEDWYTGDTYNISVGQGDILVSPLQMAVATAAVANGGTVLKPHLVSKVQDAKGKVVKEIKPEVVSSGFISAQNLAIVRQGMRETMRNPKGTACCRFEEEVPVPTAGKTGTAETATAVGDKVAAPESWFVSFAPYDKPKIVTVVFLEKAGEGSAYAAPATREILKWYFTDGAGSIIAKQ